MAVSQSLSGPADASKGARRAGWIITALVVLFLLFDGITKIMKAPAVMEAFARLGYPARLAPVIGTILVVCTVILPDSADVDSGRNFTGGVSWRGRRIEREGGGSGI